MSSFFLKTFALIFMIIDHIGYILFPDLIILRAIGRLAFPLFSYQTAVSFSHTKNKSRHIIKLLLFAILCQIPTTIANNLYSTKLTLNIIFTFIISLLIIMIFETFNIITKDSTNDKKHIISKNLLISSSLNLLLVVLGTYLNVDYSWYGILLTVAFYFTLSNKALSIVSFSTLLVLNYILKFNFMSLLGLISLLDCIFILFFNGKRGYKLSWVFYVLYFFHFVPLLFIRYFLI